MIEANLLFINGNVLTLDKDNFIAGSIAVSGDKIVGRWTEKKPPESELSQVNNCKVIDLQGATLIPGFIDTHNHILMHALNMNKIDCSTPANKSIKDILNKIQARSESVPTSKWIEGYGYDDTLLEEMRHPTRAELDEAAPNHPVFLNHVSGHLVAVNSKALELADIDESVKDTKKGQFGRDRDGKLNGVLYEKGATQPIEDVIPVPSEETIMSLIKKAADEYLAQGITTNTDAGVGLVLGEKDIDIHLNAAKQRVNPMRTQLMIMHNLLRKDGVYAGYNAEQLDKELQNKSDGFAFLDSAKMFQDGSIQGLTGALREPYHNAPDVVGETIHEQDVFEEEILDLHKRGFRIAIHGNGDRAIGSIIDAYENAIRKAPRGNHLHRIEHLQTATTADLDKMKKLDIAGSIFINHVYYWGDRHKNIFLGEERARRINPLADIAERDILFTLHSDCPITPISPLFSIWAAVNRLTRDGKVLGPEQRIDVVSSLKSMTIYGAELIDKADSLGSIECGKKADFAVLDKNPLEISPNELKDINVLATYIGGEKVYDQKVLETVKE
jgi:predicted amidohydrolase YtcJ